MRDEREKQARFFELGESYFWLSGQNILIDETLSRYLDPAHDVTGGRGLRILDLGCGPGNMLRRLRRWGTVVGTDFSLDALAFARTKGVSRVLSCDSIALPFASASFDCVIALDMLEHVEDDVGTMREIRRVLRPDGVFLFTVPASMALWRHHDVMYGHFRRYSRRDLRARVERADLRVSECRFFKCAFYPLLWVLAKVERLLQNVVPPRDNFYRVPRWANRLMETEIVWEDRLGVTRVMPFGVSLVCVGHR